jgi:hypothetical protein
MRTEYDRQANQQNLSPTGNHQFHMRPENG